MLRNSFVNQEPGLKIGLDFRGQVSTRVPDNYIVSSEIGSGFEEPSRTPETKDLGSTLPPSREVEWGLRFNPEDLRLRSKRFRRVFCAKRPISLFLDVREWGESKKRRRWGGEWRGR